MNTQPNATNTVSDTQVTLPKSREKLLGEETEKALGQQKQEKAETMRAVEQLKEELQHKIDVECHDQPD
ncbi:hypothetical protein IQ270_07715 [Microcoleus sp. LEGE 07076]|uniref:hypothetical protein n=1 Tax=Microcoleus sp. LEGE 07076 TaxID=915322 RepID=UPI0018829305|nr:hypothetical protein [Microcoleus sp. LEGE 07076]MBE9184609.1 hypothetical protein [Microcoleus sp. LEGE 07076]